MILKRSEAAKNLLTTVTILLLFSYTLSFFLSSYLQITLTESLIFRADDGWCRTATQGIGIHCFGDFFSMMNPSIEAPWHESGTAYPPFSLLLFRLLYKIYLLSNGGNFALLLYLLGLILSLIFPIIHLHLTKRIRSLRVTLIFLFALLVLAPSLMVLDRGNNIGFAVPLVYLTYLFAIQQNYRGMAITTTLLCLWKPQLGVLSLYFVFHGQYRLFIRWAIMTSFGFLLSFSFFGFRDIFGNLKDFVQNLLGYQNYVSIPGIYPSNWSFANLVGLTNYLIQVLVDFTAIDLNSPPKMSSFLITMISVIFLFVSLALIKIRGRDMNPITSLTLLCILSMGVPAVTFSYYFVILLPFLILVVYGLTLDSNPQSVSLSREGEVIRDFCDSILRSLPKRLLFSMLIASCFVNWPVTWKMTGLIESEPNGNIGIVWTLGIVILYLFYLVLLLGKSQYRERKFPKVW